MNSPQTDVTLLLSEAAAGSQDAANRLVPLLYDELKRLARGYMRHERPEHTLQATALVNEAYLKLVRQADVNWQSRSHFIGVAAQIMRRILIDHARGHSREKRGGAQAVLALDDALAFSPEKSEEMLKLDAALERLSALDARQGRIVELRSEVTLDSLLELQPPQAHPADHLPVIRTLNPSQSLTYIRPRWRDPIFLRTSR